MLVYQRVKPCQIRIIIASVQWIEHHKCRQRNCLIHITFTCKAIDDGGVRDVASEILGSSLAASRKIWDPKATGFLTALWQIKYEVMGFCALGSHSASLQCHGLSYSDSTRSCTLVTQQLWLWTCHAWGVSPWRSANQPLPEVAWFIRRTKHQPPQNNERTTIRSVSRLNSKISGRWLSSSIMGYMGDIAGERWAEMLGLMSLASMHSSHWAARWEFWLLA